ncbi:cellulase family glycosylhydrolase [Compostibacter hankyongensis]|uniref:Cellulase family glycosylhydrolase n=1 Tax=Compostibacter hankyongensis TaxID=1007089 RepID=A0ABP8FT64_9BACT
MLHFFFLKKYVGSALYRSGRILCTICILCIGLSCPANAHATSPPDTIGSPGTAWIRLSKDGRHFVQGRAGQPFVIWGVNYDRDNGGRLLEDYWLQEWNTVAEDFGEIKQLGANVVRIHLQFGKFMRASGQPDTIALRQLSRLLRLAEKTGLYLDITGLGNYHKQDVPEWFGKMGEADRWKAQAAFWKAVAGVCAQSPAVFCYDLMNEPLWPSSKKETEWLAGELAGKYYCQRITLDLGKRAPEQVAKTWIHTLVSAIRTADSRHLITLGAIPMAQYFPGAGLTFCSPEVAKELDFISVHFYPDGKDVAGQIRILKTYDIGKPLLIEEMFPLKCNIDTLNAFVEASRTVAAGWIGFYWGTRPDEYPKDMAGALIRSWLAYFRQKAADITGSANPGSGG